MEPIRYHDANETIAVRIDVVQVDLARFGSVIQRTRTKVRGDELIIVAGCSFELSAPKNPGLHRTGSASSDRHNARSYYCQLAGTRIVQLEFITKRPVHCANVFLRSNQKITIQTGKINTASREMSNLILIGRVFIRVEVWHYRGLIGTGRLKNMERCRLCSLHRPQDEKHVPISPWSNLSHGW